MKKDTTVSVNVEVTGASSKEELDINLHLPAPYAYKEGKSVEVCMTYWYCKSRPRLDLNYIVALQ